MTVGAQPRMPTKLQVLAGAVTRAAEELPLPPPRRPWLPPLPAVLTIDDPRLGRAVSRDRAAAFPVGLMDLPAEQRQEPLVLDFDQLGHVLVVGRTRSGRTTVLRTLAGVVTAHVSPADVHLYGLEFRRRSLQDLERLPHCGGVAGADDPDRMERLLDFLQAEIERRGRLMGSCGSLEEYREGRPTEPLSYVLVLCDNYESFYERFSFEDGGRLVERFDWLLREGPARGIHFVVTTDQRAALHRLASVIDSQLVLRPSEQEAKIAFGLTGRSPLPELPPGRGFWAAGPYEVQVSLLPGSPSGEGQANAVGELAARAWATAQGIPADRLPTRVGALPDSLTFDQAETLRRRPRLAGGAVATFAVGGLDVAPLDVDLRAAGYTFSIVGPRGSGRSTALLSLVTSLLRSPGDDRWSVCAVAPRRSPLRQLEGLDRVTVLTQADALATQLGLALAASPGPSVLVIDDAELLIDNPVAMQLDQLVRRASDDDRLVIIGGTTVDLLRRFSGWTFEARQSRSGLLLQPASAAEGEILDLRLPRSTGTQGEMPAGRGVLVVRGRWVAAQVVLPVLSPTAF
jgi:S-DNA-T family DNA segregation ATPase FtsK/SpoIIIE